MGGVDTIIAAEEAAVRYHRRDRPLEGVGIGLDCGWHRMLVEPGGVLPGDHSDDVTGESADLLVDGALGVRPCGVAVRVVGLEQDVVRTDPLVLDER